MRDKRKLISCPKLFSILLFLLFIPNVEIPACFAENPPTFLRGDANSDKVVDISDAVFILGYLFGKGAVPSCLDQADSNDDGRVDISDPIVVLGTLFLGQNQIALFYPYPFYDWTTDDTYTCGDIPSWLKEMLENPQGQPPADPNRDPFEGPGAWDYLYEQGLLNPVMLAVAMIKLMSPDEWAYLESMNPDIYNILIQIHDIDFNDISDYELLLRLLNDLGSYLASLGVVDVNLLITNGVPEYVANVLPDAINAADSTTASDLQADHQQQNQSLEDSIGGAADLYHVGTGPEVDPTDDYFCYICGSGCDSDGGTTGGGKDSGPCGMKVAYDIYFSPAEKPAKTAMAFIQQLVNEVKKDQDPCCQHEVYVRIPDTGQTTKANAEAAAKKVNAEINKIAGNPDGGDQCVREIVFNLYCFSASCIEVIHFVQNLQPCDTPCDGCECCGEPFDKIKKSINIVSMEGLFDGDPTIFGPVSNFCAGIGTLAGRLIGAGAYACSAFEEDYGGEEPPCVCSFNAYSRDEGAGSTDSNLNGWSIQSHQINAENHPDVLNQMINNPSLWNEIKPKCECQNTTAQ